MKKNTFKSSILTCEREDGTTTWTKLYKGFEHHDLAHYAVETVLEFDSAFFGLIIKGFDINDFDKSKEEKPDELQSYNLPKQALQTEHIVNLLLTEHQNGNVIPNFLKLLKDILQKNNIDFPKNLTDNSLEKIRRIYRDKVENWNVLKSDESLILNF